MITDEQVHFFLEENFEGIKDKLDHEIIRDILTLSKLYDRNYERVRQAHKDGEKSRHLDLLKVCNSIEDASNLLRDLTGIRAK